MGGCLGCLNPNSRAVQSGAAMQSSSQRGQQNSFQGKGNRLGSAYEHDQQKQQKQQQSTSKISNNNDDPANLPAPRKDPSLSEAERSQQRDARLAAIEKRMPGATAAKKKKKPPSNSEPLRGPNSQPLMRWT
mmetsp:Transcript_6201/g.13368  ORF Transcript_6201/g.13368 Transcript_6201/m.13368 type:complete len:132 (-) Transcript_6201:625-1020(-)